ncbi:MAG: two-component system sensor histidine kinase PilS (NtrC family), partial [Candidatus Azotimanducaceae bacterium]
DPAKTEIIAEIERRQTELNYRLFGIYHGYRFFIAIALLATSIQTVVSTRLGSFNEMQFFWTISVYAAFAAAILVSTRLPFRDLLQRSSATLYVVIADIVVMTFLMYVSGGISSGLGALILIAVAAGAILVEGRAALFVAAIASICILYEEFYIGLSIRGEVDVFQAGVFGTLYFTAAWAIQRFSKRVRENDILALTQEAELADLSQLNQQIIQRMRTGIIVVDGEDRIRMHNASARSLLGAQVNSPLVQLPKTVAESLSAWRNDTTLRPAPFRALPYTSEIRVNFSVIRSTQSDGDVTIFIEDTSEVQQQAQQLKLAELGQLSASIAHEVRNPLGAISHAAQLLNESTDLTEADQRLTDIITNHCERMNGVVENVLEMSRRRHPQPQRMHLDQALVKFTNQADESFVDAEIETDIAPETMIRIDPSHLIQVLTNLVDNGLRYSEAQGNNRKVRLEGGIEESSDRPFLNVIDYGAGVEESQIANLFQPFSTTAPGGTGLGLYLSKEMCDANQVQLSYLKHEQGGSCFRILFAHPDRIS